MPSFDLQKLRAFEAAARHLSFTIAGNELSVSQSAVSQQIRNLEATLGVRLFVRRTRALSLTEEGRTLAVTARDVIDRVDRTVVQIADKSPSGLLRISCLPAFATLWLAAKLSKFNDAYPLVRLQLWSTSETLDFRADQADVAIRWGEGPWPNAQSYELFRDSYAPVCSPQFAEANPIGSVSDLARLPRLYDMDSSRDIWLDWFQYAELDGLVSGAKSAGLAFETTADLIQACQAGAGVALVRLGLAREAIRQGRLVRPVSQALPSPSGYHLVHAPSRRGDPKIKAFLGWLKDECRGEPGHTASA